MKTKQYFKKGDDISSVISGRYGRYGKTRLGLNHNEKWWLENGYEVVSLTKEEAELFNEKYRQQTDALQKAEYESKMQDRFAQVEICLNSEPLAIEPNTGGHYLIPRIANVTGKMRDAYHGCGKATAYIRDDKVVAFHYGYAVPDNSPDLPSVKVELSCCQICFFD